MGSLSGDSELVLASGVGFESRDGRLVVETAIGSRSYDLDTLALLHAFRAPRTMADGLAAALATTGRDFVTLSSRVIELADAGVLCGPAGARFAGDDGTFDGAAIHLAMLDDEARTQSYIDAIRSRVRPDDVVLDIGTGTGILAVAAAQAGARHVYAVDRGPIAALAKRVIADNGVDDRCTVMQCLSTQAELPERATLLISEIVGNDPFGEGIVKTYADANARLVTPDARRIPHRLSVSAHLVEVPDEIRREHVADSTRLDGWASRYGIDLSALRGASPSEPLALYLSTARAQRLAPVSSPSELTTVDLADVRPTLRTTASLVAQRDARVTGIVITFEIELDKRRRITSNVNANPGSHWRTPLWLLPRPLELVAGNAVTIAWRTSPTGSRLGLVT